MQDLKLVTRRFATEELPEKLLCSGASFPGALCLRSCTAALHMMSVHVWEQFCGHVVSDADASTVDHLWMKHITCCISNTAANAFLTSMYECVHPGVQACLLHHCKTTLCHTIVGALQCTYKTVHLSVARNPRYMLHVYAAVTNARFPVEDLKPLVSLCGASAQHG
jgi:hypothetical protein